MDVRDRSTYPPNLGNLGIEIPSRPPSRTQPASSTRGIQSWSDSSALSPAAQVIAQAMQMPDVRQARVANLQLQIASGNYQVAPQEVANAMLRNLAG